MAYNKGHEYFEAMPRNQASARFNPARDERYIRRNKRNVEMAITATITTAHPHDEIKALFAMELERKHERSSIALDNASGKATFTITANDTTALRAAINTVTSVLAVYEKTVEATNGK